MSWAATSGRERPTAAFIPTPLFGLGLVENTSDEALRASFAANARQNSSLGISGNFNTSGNTGNITRFGWKAQNPSLLVFAAEAYGIEHGVTNDGFPKSETAHRRTAYSILFPRHDPSDGLKPQRESGLGLLLGHRQFRSVYAHDGAADPGDVGHADDLIDVDDFINVNGRVDIGAVNLGLIDVHAVNLSLIDLDDAGSQCRSDERSVCGHRNLADIFDQFDRFDGGSDSCS